MTEETNKPKTLQEAIAQVKEAMLPPKRPGAPGSTLIQKGDTLSGIAKSKNMSVNDIMKLNPNIKDPNKISAGGSLNLNKPSTGPQDNPGLKSASPQFLKPRTDTPKPMSSISPAPETKWIDPVSAGKTADKPAPSAPAPVATATPKPVIAPASGNDKVDFYGAEKKVPAPTMSLGTSDAAAARTGSVSDLSKPVDPGAAENAKRKANTLNKEQTNPLIDAFLKLQETNGRNVFEDAKKLSKKQDEKLDVVDDDKIDAKDLAALRAGKKKVEEGEEQIDEVSKRLATRAYRKSIHKGDAEYDNDYGDEAMTHYIRAKRIGQHMNKKHGIDVNKKGQHDRVPTGWKVEEGAIREEEQIDESNKSVTFHSVVRVHTDPHGERGGDGPSVGHFKTREGAKAHIEKLKAEHTKGFTNPKTGKLRVTMPTWAIRKNTLKEEVEQTESVEFSQAEIDHLNSFFEAVAPSRPEPTKGINPTVKNTDLTDETIEEKLTDDAKANIRTALSDKMKKSSAPARSLIKLAKMNPSNVKEEENLEEGRPKKNPEPETTDRDPRQHIQVMAGRAAAGNVLDFKHENGKTSKLTPGMGRAITAHLNSLKPADRQTAVNKMHASPEGLKV